MPESSHSREVNKWINAIKRTLSSKEDHKHLDAYIEDTHKAFYKLTKEDRPSIQDIAAMWGLPVKVATTYSDQAAIKVSAVAAYLTATMTS